MVGFNEQTVDEYLHAHAGMREALAIAAQDDLKVEFLARGEYNVNYVCTHPASGQRLVFRVNLGSQMQLADQVGYEARALALLDPSGRTPKLYYVDSSKGFFGYGVLIESWFPGRALRYETDMQEAAQILADIHAVPVPVDHGLIEPKDPLRGMLEECTTMFEYYRGWSGAQQGIVARIDMWFTRAQRLVEVYAPGSRKHLINTELNAGNFLINEQGSNYLVDWEKPLIAEVEQDLAHFLAPTTTFWKTDTILNRQEAQGFLALYCQAVGDRFETSQILERLQPYMTLTCLRGLTWSAMALAQHYSRQRPVADDATLGKIKVYLTNDFLDRLDI